MRIYDLDGVIFDLVGHLIKHGHLDKVPTSYDLDFDWLSLDQSFWETVPVYKDVYRDVINRLLNGEMITLITAYHVGGPGMRCPVEKMGKIRNLARWGLANIPLIMHPVTVPRREFYIEGATLIDDREENITEWPGHGELVPRPWNGG